MPDCQQMCQQLSDLATYSFGDVVNNDSCRRVSIVHWSEGVELRGQQIREIPSRDQALHALLSQHVLMKRKLVTYLVQPCPRSRI